MVKWFGAQYNQEVRFSSAVKCKKEPQVLTSLLNQRLSDYRGMVKWFGAHYNNVVLTIRLHN